MTRLVNLIPTHLDICLSKFTAFGIKHQDYKSEDGNYGTIIFLKPQQSSPQNHINFHVFCNYHQKDPPVGKKETCRNETFVFLKSPKDSFIAYEDRLNSKKYKVMHQDEIEEILSTYKTYKKIVEDYYSENND
jgi:hypothetical protein